MRALAWTLAGMLAIGAPVAPHDPPAALSAWPAILPAWAGHHPRFGWSGAWFFPVGDRYEIGRPGSDGSPAYRINRCIGGPEEGANRHDGADLSCGRGGDLVRAASHGIVVRAEAHGWNGGFGRHVVIAHRLVDGGLAYSVYAHLADQSVRVRKGQLVAAGQPLGRVGRSGRATSAHLHFEVRLAHERDEPWQKAEVLDPVTFVSENLPSLKGDTSAAAPYLEWAQCAAMLESTVPGDSTLDRATWWRMLAYAARQPRDELPEEPEGLRQMLVETGVLAADDACSPADSLSWGGLASDLRRLRKVGVMVARPPITPAAHRALCERRLGARRPSQALDRLQLRKDVPLLEDVCLVLADLSGTWETPKKKAKKPDKPAGTSPPPPSTPGVRAGGEVDAGPR